MEALKYRSIDDLYQTDLDRRLFAPAGRRPRRETELIPLRVRDWLEMSWARWKALAQVWSPN